MSYSLRAAVVLQVLKREVGKILLVWSIQTMLTVNDGVLLSVVSWKRLDENEQLCLALQAS